MTLKIVISGFTRSIRSTEVGRLMRPDFFALHLDGHSIKEKSNEDF